ncbi:hypothetical protein [Mesorhizobium temperatum]|uniref:Uncharacterized protein n=1 Tax=Mesorhizobium temperatum TaxID=241416 RepID=A0A271LVT3_9HYPH|nr:hypothetical protein [Mesorhizobium temperatum]PAQ12281.1 hypothetical protein CIT26_01485 [Mesorhizobium temperatum]
MPKLLFEYRRRENRKALGIDAGECGSNPISTLKPSDNAGLGLARALSVVNYLRQLPELSSLDVTFIPMSGGQLIMPGDTVTGRDQCGCDSCQKTYRGTGEEARSINSGF